MIKSVLLHCVQTTSIALLILLSFNLQAKRTEYQIEIRNHLFYPAKIIIPSNEKVKLVIHNKDDNVEEFDSFDLNREKVIFPHRSAVIFIGPLSAGEYSFFGEYNPYSARGKVVVKEQFQDKQTIKGEQHVN